MHSEKNTVVQGPCGSAEARQRDGQIPAAAIRQRAGGCDAVLVGCGLGRSPGCDGLVRRLLDLPRPLVLELGCGKGAYAAAMAAAHPEINYLAVDYLSDVLVLATSAGGADGAAAADVTWVTVAVKPESVQEVIAASRKAELYFALPAAGEGAGLDAREGSL